MVESNRTIQPSQLPSFAYFSRVSVRVPTNFRIFCRIQDPAASRIQDGADALPCAALCSCQTKGRRPNGLKCVKQHPSARIEKPCDHKESQKSSVDAHIDSQSRMLSSHTPRQPNHHCYFLHFIMESPALNGCFRAKHEHRT